MKNEDKEKTLRTKESSGIDFNAAESAFADKSAFLSQKAKKKG